MADFKIPPAELLAGLLDHCRKEGADAADARIGESEGVSVSVRDGALDGLDQVLWPVHCVQGSSGAEFVESLETRRIAGVFRKGMNPRIDSYSGFHDNGHRRSTGMAGYLRELGVEQVYVLGVATDYCVKFTALDARREGFETYLIEDGCRGVELADGDITRAIDAMKDAGVKVIQSAEL